MAYQLLLGDVSVELSPYFREELEGAGVPADLIGVVAGCLALPERRYRDGADLLAALEPAARRLGLPDARFPERRDDSVPESGKGSVRERPDTAGARPKVSLVLRTKRRTYSVAGALASGPIADVFRATAIQEGRESPVFVKIVRSPEDNEFIENEVRVLRHLRADKRSEKFSSYLPETLDSFQILDPGTKRLLQATATAPYEGITTLDEVIRAYPDGIDPRDMAWMWKRVLGLAAVAHSSGILHGGLVPPFIGFDLENHDPFLADWPFAVTTKEARPIQAIVPGYEEYCPPEILRKDVPTPATDLYMIGKCMIRLLGGSVETGQLPSSVPLAIQRLLRASTLPEASRRLDDAWQLHQEFDGQLERLFGPKKFRKFALPRS
jgi:serine/threonine protein kinase